MVKMENNYLTLSVEDQNSVIAMAGILKANTFKNKNDLVKDFINNELRLSTNHLVRMASEIHKGITVKDLNDTLAFMNEVYESQFEEE